MISRKEETITRHKKGYNCAQAVACTYCDLVGMDEETMFKATEALGGGLGIWGVINLLEGCGNDNPGAKSTGFSRQ